MKHPPVPPVPPIHESTNASCASGQVLQTASGEDTRREHVINCNINVISEKHAASSTKYLFCKNFDDIKNPSSFTTYVKDAQSLWTLRDRL